LLREFAALACNLNQLLVGWHADGTAWSEWDQQQLDALISLQIRVEAYLRYATAGSGLREVIETAMLKCGLTVTPGLSNAVLAAVESHNRGIIWQNHDTLAQERDALAAKVAQEKAHHEFYQGKVLAYMGAEIEWQKKCTALRERVAGLEKALDWALNSMNPPFDWEEFKRASTLIGIRDCTTPAALAAVDARKEGEK
jgi:hypothetical protein